MFTAYWDSELGTYLHRYHMFEGHHLQQLFPKLMQSISVKVCYYHNPRNSFTITNIKRSDHSWIRRCKWRFWYHQENAYYLSQVKYTSKNIVNYLKMWLTTLSSNSSCFHMYLSWWMQHVLNLKFHRVMTKCEPFPDGIKISISMGESKSDWNIYL